MTIQQFRVFMAEEIDEYILPVLHSGYIGQGARVEEFEAALKLFLDLDKKRDLLTVNSATSGLMLALRMVGAGPGTSVVSTPMTCSATNEAIALMGAEIVWADIDQWGNIDPEDVAKKVKQNTVAVMAVDWGGLPASYKQIREGLKALNNHRIIPIIEDAAHAFGAEYKGKSVANTGGDYVVYSFQAIKHLTTGDGGAVVLPAGAPYQRAKLLRWYGLDRTNSDAMRSRQDIKEVGFKFHMNDIAASIGLANIDYMKDIISKHQHNAKVYEKTLPDDVITRSPTDRVSADWFYTIHVKEPISFERWMKEKGVTASQVHYRNDKYSVFAQYNAYLPNLNAWFDTMCAIPCGWWLDEGDLDWIDTCVREYMK